VAVDKRVTQIRYWFELQTIANIRTWAETMLTPASRTEPNIFRFGVFHFHAGSLELVRQGIRIRLQPQPARLLLLLLERSGQLVSRETIRELLWSDGTTVDFEVGVNRCIRRLRVALSDDVGAPRYIKTIPRTGYCFIAPVSGGPVQALAAPAVAAAPTPTTAPADIDSRQQQHSVAVLPFVNLSSNPEDEYFSDGLSEEIINALTQVPGLKVIARTSAFTFKGRNEDIRAIGETLGVSNVLEGSVRRAGNRIRVTAQLIQAADGVHVSSRRYDREITDVFAVQDEISSDIAEQFKFRLRSRKRSTANLSAYEAYLEGRFHWNRYTPAEFDKALRCFERAVAIDPTYAAAYAGIAHCYLGLVVDAGAPARDLLPKAAAAARRALEMDETDAEAHAALGEVAAMLDYDWAAAELHFRRARELNPGAYVRIAYATWYLIPQMRTEEAAAEADLALRNDPLLLLCRQLQANARMYGRDYGAAAECCLRVLDIDPAFSKALQMLSYIRCMQRRFQEGLAYAERLAEVVGRSSLSLCTLGMAHAAAGRREAASLLLDEIKTLPAGPDGGGFGMACIYASLGEEDAAFEALNDAIQKREPKVVWLRLHPFMDSLRSDPRYAALLRKMNFATGYAGSTISGP
jgi:TolB-like protein/Tfp pilus assembly protein PilF